MLESQRSLFYLLGLVPNLLFGIRFLIQWIQSEKKKQSTVTKSFWRISFLANTLMCVHAFIQLQYPVCLIQALAALIAMRNLELLKHKPTLTNRKKTLLYMTLCCVGITALFFSQNNPAWMRAPTLPWNGTQALNASLAWHLLGFFGMVLFASRFWIQWWLAEKYQKSYLGKSFWWTSCLGAILCLGYFLRLHDVVNILGYGVGLIPYIRNLVLLNKKTPPPKTNPELFFLAGEQSGDLLGGKLIEALKQRLPTVSLTGVGGPEMKKAGMQIMHPMERFQVMGFSDVIKALPRLYKDFRKIQKEILRTNPAGVVLIDYPDFNMHLAKTLRKKGYRGKLIQYVCPSVWAWRKKRIGTLTQTLDHLLSILPFEDTCFKNTSLPVTYVGHPLIATLDHHPYDSQFKLPKPLIALFPGSRKHEIELNLPLQYAAAKKFGKKIAVSVAKPEYEELIKQHVDEHTLLISCEKRYELMRAAEGAFATSGTVILELGLHCVPTVVTYKLSPLNYFLGRYIFRVHLPFYTLVNIICDTSVYPEFIHKDINALQVFTTLKNMLDDPQPCKDQCLRLRHLLNTQNASTLAANTIEKELYAMPLS